MVESLRLGEKTVLGRLVGTVMLGHRALKVYWLETEGRTVGVVSDAAVMDGSLYIRSDDHIRRALS